MFPLGIGEIILPCTNTFLHNNDIFQSGIFRNFQSENFFLSSLTFILCSQHDLPNLKCSEEDCLADFVLRRDTRLKYPGACSLEFQSVMQILTKCMVRWDTKTQSSRGKGILGTVLAFFGADEEQGRKILKNRRKKGRYKLTININY